MAVGIVHVVDNDVTIAILNLRHVNSPDGRGILSVRPVNVIGSSGEELVTIINSGDDVLKVKVAEHGK